MFCLLSPLVAAIVKTMIRRIIGLLQNPINDPLV